MHYTCAECGRVYDLSTPRWRCECGGFLDLDSPALRVGDIDTGQTGVWRYPSVLPPVPPEHRISLGEHTTPLIRVPALEVMAKLDHLLPSGSYKDRGATVLVSRLKHSGLTDIVLDSSGNAGAAMATYCAAAGITCRVYVPAANSRMKLAQIAAVGGKLEPVQGSRADTTRAAMDAGSTSFYASHNWSPEFVTGLATVAFEIFEQMGRRVPSSVLAPCGNGGIVLGLSRGFDALARGGLVDRVPRLLAVQSAAFDSVSYALTHSLADPPKRSNGATLAEGIAAEQPVRGRQVLEAIRSSGGSAVAVSEARIVEATLLLASAGVYAEPTAAVGVAGLLELRASESAALGETPLVIISGAGLKSGLRIADLRNPQWWPADTPRQAGP